MTTQANPTLSGGKGFTAPPEHQAAFKALSFDEAVKAHRSQGNIPKSPAPRAMSPFRVKGNFRTKSQVKADVKAYNPASLGQAIGLKAAL